MPHMWPVVLSLHNTSTIHTSHTACLLHSDTIYRVSYFLQAHKHKIATTNMLAEIFHANFQNIYSLKYNISMQQMLDTAEKMYLRGYCGLASGYEHYACTFFIFYLCVCGHM